MVTDGNISSKIFYSSIFLWTFIFLTDLVLFISIGSSYENLESEFFNLAGQYSFQAFDPDAEIDKTQTYTFVAVLFFELITFVASFYGIFKRRTWGIYAVCIHVFFYYFFEWVWSDDVAVSFKSAIFLSSMMNFMTGIFFCSAFWVTSDRDTSPAVLIPHS